MTADTYKGRKWGITAAGIIAVSNSTFASSLPSGSLPYIEADFHIQHDEIAILTISLFLMGYVIGYGWLGSFAGGGR
jgi:hypothetical protein